MNMPKHPTSKIEILTAETPKGRAAIEEVIAHGDYVADIDAVPPDWARVRVADGVPVSFILVDPGREMDQPGGRIRYGFILDVATRKDRRMEGHFRALMAHTFENLKSEGVPAVVLHGRYQLYRRFGFEVFTHHAGVFITPDAIERALETGTASDEGVSVQDGRYIKDGLLLVTEIGTGCAAQILRAAAAIARERAKSEILFEDPPAPSYGSRYPIYDTVPTAFGRLAASIGGRVVIQGADPESGTIPDADWIKVLDATAFVREAAGAEIAKKVQNWPGGALAQLVTGYRDARTLVALHSLPLSAQEAALLDDAFPRRWRFSRNESWTYRD